MGKKLTVVLLVMVLSVCALAAWSQDGPARQGGQRWQQRPGAAGGSACVCATLMVPPPEMIQFAATRLTLTDDQKSKLTAVLEAAKPKLEPLRGKAGESMAALRKALFSDKDAAAVKEAVDAASKAEAAVSAAELDVWLQIRPILSADQLKMLGEAMGRTGRPMRPAPGGPGGPPQGDPPPPPPPAE